MRSGWAWHYVDIVGGPPALPISDFTLSRPPNFVSIRLSPGVRQQSPTRSVRGRTWTVGRADAEFRRRGENLTVGRVETAVKLPAAAERTTGVGDRFRSELRRTSALRPKIIIGSAGRSFRACPRELSPTPIISDY